MNEYPSCWKCRHFGISWDERFPYECRVMSFKSKTLPCLDVLRIDGRPCQSYAKKLKSVTSQMINATSGIVKGSNMDDLI